MPGRPFLQIPGPTLVPDRIVQAMAQTRRLSLGIGGAVKGKVLRIGHLGSPNALDLLGGLAGVEMALKEFGGSSSG